TLLAFDKDFAVASGMPVKSIRLVLTVLVVLAVVIGIQAVGVILMAAMLITPAAAARYWTDSVKIMVILASMFGAVSGLSGAYISWLAPSLPTGPWIVVVISAIAFFSFFLAPKKGIVARYIKQRNNRRIINSENVLKALYQLGEETHDFLAGRTLGAISDRRRMSVDTLRFHLKRLAAQGYVSVQGSAWALTPEGMKKGKRIVRLHRLWELYLTTKMNIAPDHVHDDADTVEHLITPELEAELEQQLNYPSTDPHASTIPYEER
ncbi:MAG: metal ABC transporter permease, partial [Bacteroidota bacterium]